MAAPDRTAVYACYSLDPDAARATERIPELLGLGAHLPATAISPPGS
ncbi:MAG TPA: hypothetical protein VMU94_07365 [Streptosporangiaceae bacterium]|nr:hypothetical protein [Streptosporangiaceae bacterium]